jgi:hypothetical protein
MPRTTVRPEAELDALDSARDSPPVSFGVFFIVEAETAVVLAVTHLPRHPIVWLRRA